MEEVDSRARHSRIHILWSRIQLCTSVVHEFGPLVANSPPATAKSSNFTPRAAIFYAAPSIKAWTLFSFLR